MSTTTNVLETTDTSEALIFETPVAASADQPLEFCLPTPFRRRAMRLAAWAAALSIGASTGCGEAGPPLGEVSGAVKLDGKPLAQALVHFQPQKGAPSFAVTDARGAYRLRYSHDFYGASPGVHSVRITTARTTENAKGDETELPERLPAVYHSRSQLSRDVKLSSNKFDFDLQSKPTPGKPTQTARR